MKFIILVFLLGILFRMIFRYIVPIFRVASTANEHMRRMQDQMKEMDRRMNQNTPPTVKNQPSGRDGDYIDYEEVK